MDVWFDSGSTWAAVADARDCLKYPADLYLEGGDQYRGWFQSSMLTSIAVNGVAPYKQIVTHGWTVDGEGKAMHKSLGNAVSPDDVTTQYGADILRLWVASADYTQDMRISKEILKQLSDAYLKIRNTARYMLGNLDGFDPDADMVPFGEMQSLDRWAVARLGEVAQLCRKDYDVYEFHGVYRTLYNFCVVDLSNFYFDVIKDRLYCGDAQGRKSARSALYIILDGLCRLLAPILAFTTDEIWKAMPHAKDADPTSPLLNDMPDADPATALSVAETAKWAAVMALRTDVNKALELARGEKKIGKSLEAQVTLYFDGEAKNLWENQLGSFDPADLADLCIVSHVDAVLGSGTGYAGEAIEGLTVAVAPAEGEKCGRCWKHDAGVNADGLCPRCAAVLEQEG